MAVTRSVSSVLVSTLVGASPSELRILPRRGSTAWVRLLRPCLAEPPARSPSTMNSSDSSRSVDLQSASLPGRFRRRCVTDLRLTSWPLRATPGGPVAASTIRPTIWSAAVMLPLSQASRAGRTKLSTVAVISGLLSFSLVCPWNMRLADEDRQDADDALADVLGGDVRPLILTSCVSMKLRIALTMALLKPFSCVPPDGGADAVDVGADRLVGRFGPLQGDFHLLAVVAGEGEGRLGDRRLLAVGRRACRGTPGCRPGWVRSSVSLVTSFLKVILRPLWMYDMSSRWALISSASNCVVLKISGSGSK